MVKLYMFLLGCRPRGRNTEQHDIFFGIAGSVKELIPEIKAFWPEAKDKLHVDAWREVNTVGNFSISISERKDAVEKHKNNHLFFINLGGYQKGLFDEPHFKILTVQRNIASAIKYSKETDFFRMVHFEDARSHIDDKFGVDVDEIYEVSDILPDNQKEKFSLVITPAENLVQDALHLGYFKLSTFA